MSLYEYECKACGVRFERRQLIADDPVKTCPECGGEVRRLLHPVGIIFKGKGFYVTDNPKARSSTVAPKVKEGSKASKTNEVTGKD
jgi:putative FmdB family regulatory protein